MLKTTIKDARGLNGMRGADSNMGNTYEAEVGKTILNRDGNIRGTITKITNRWCGGCQSYGSVYSVKWEDGKRTFPCPAGCKCNEDGTIQIV